jgi:hypothetical protein
MSNQVNELGGEAYEAVNEANLGRPAVLRQAVENALMAQRVEIERDLASTAV